MGRSKALLPAGAGGPTFVRRLADALREGGITDILGGRPARRWTASRRGGDAWARVRYVENRRSHEGQISSIVAAVNAVDRPGVQGLLVVPVDQPLVTSATVAQLLAAFARVRPPIARAAYRGRHGHPVVFGPVVFGELRLADPAVGARSVVRGHGDAVLDVEVPDEAVLIDVDDPEAYARVFGNPGGQPS